MSDQRDPNSVYSAQMGKLDEIYAASREKQAFLTDYVANAAATRAAHDAQYEGSGLGILGLDPNGIPGTLLNFSSAIGGGFTRLVGQVGSGLHTLDAQQIMSAIPDEVIQADRRSRLGQATREDLLLLTKLNGRYDNHSTNQELVNAARDQLSRANFVADKFDISSGIYQGNKDALERDFRSGDAQKGLDLLSEAKGDFSNGNYGDALRKSIVGATTVAKEGISAGLNNPKGATEYILENVPQALAAATGSAGAVTSNALYGADTYRSALADRMKADGGAIPQSPERQDAALWSAAAFAAEHLGDHFTGVIGAGVTKATPKAVQSSLKDSILGSIANSKPFKVAADVNAGAIGEFGTEAFQTYAENNAANKPTTGLDAAFSGVIGALSGGAMAGGVSTINQTAQKAVELINQEAAKQTSKLQLKAAAETGDTAAMLDPSSPGFNPVDGMKATLAYARNTSMTAQDKNARLSTIMDTQMAMEANLRALEAQTSAGQQSIAGELKQTQDYLASLPQDSAERNDVQSKIDSLIKLQQVPVLEGKELKKAQKKIQEETDKINTVSSMAEVFFKMETPKVDAGNTPTTPPVDTPAAAPAAVKTLDEQIQHINTPGVDSTAEVEHVFNMAMTAPENLSVSQLNSLVSNSSNGLSTAQRNHLRTLSAAKVAENALKNGDTVNQEVMFGNKKLKQLGIQDYTQRLATAIGAGNAKMAAQQLNGLRSFLASHTEKARKYEEALKQAKEIRSNTGNANGVAAMRLADGSIELKPVPEGTDLVAFDAELRKTGSNRIHSGSGSLVSSVQREQAALQSSLKASLSAYHMAFQGESKPAQKTAPRASTPAANPVSIAPPATAQIPSSAPATPTPMTASSPTQESAPKTKQVPSVAPTTAPVESKPAQRQSEPTESKPAKKQVAETVPTEQAVQAPTEPQQSESDSLGFANQEIPLEEDIPQDISQDVQTEDVGVTPPSTAKLSVYDNTLNTEGLTPAEIFEKANLIAHFTRQVQQREGAKTQKPLAAIKDFFSAWGKNNNLAAEYLGQTEFSTAETNALSHLFFTIMGNGKNVGWKSVVDSQIGKKILNPAFRMQDMMQFLITDDANGRPVVEENVAAAIAVAAYLVAQNKSRSVTKMKTEASAEMHGFSKNTRIYRPKTESKSFNPWQTLQNLHTFEDTLIDELGKSVVQMLGIKATKDAPLDLMPHLINAFGSHALVLMEKQGAITRTAYPADRVMNWFYDGKRVPTSEVSNKLFHYVTFNKVNGFAEASKGSGNIVEKLFDSTDSALFAEQQPSDFTQKFASGTQQEVPKSLADVLQRVQQVPHSLIPDMAAVMIGLGREMFLRVAGVEDATGVPRHITEVDGIEAQNDNLARQLDLAMEMLGMGSNFEDFTPEILNKKFFIKFDVWRNDRVGITTASLNQQTSKIHRAIFQREGWESTIKMDDQEMIDTLTVAIAQGLGFKVDQIPKQTTVDTLTSQIASNKDMAQAIQTIKNGVVLQDETAWTDASRANVAKVASKEGALSLQAMIAMAKLEHARENNLKEFKVTLLTGVDGKTNGPMLTHLALGAAADVDSLFGILNRGGMYSNAEGQPTSFAEWYQRQGSLDLYQRIAEITDRFSKELARKHDKAGLPGTRRLLAVKTFIGELVNETGAVTKDGRNIVKTPITGFGFGSSLSRASAAMAETFIEKVYASFTGLASEPRKDGKTLRDIIEDLNLLMRSAATETTRPGFEIPVNSQITDMLNYEFTDQQLKLLTAAFKEEMGNSASSALESYFPVFIERRNGLNTATNTAYHLYASLKSFALRNAKEALVESGDIHSYTPMMKDPEDPTKKIPAGENKASHELNQEQEAKALRPLWKLQPLVHSVFSQEDNRLSAGIMMEKSNYSVGAKAEITNAVFINGGVTTASGVAGFNKNTGYAPGNANAIMGKSTMLRSNSSSFAKSAPGVSGTPYLIHSLDSGIMHSSYGEEATPLNIHDEKADGVHAVNKAAEAINRSTVEALLNFSPAAQAYNTLVRQIQEMNKQFLNGVFTANAIYVAFYKTVSEYNERASDADSIPYAVKSIAVLLERARENAIAADRIRLGAIAQMGVMDQYTWEGGQFQVTEAIREEAKRKLAEVEATEKQAPEYIKDLANLLNAEVTEEIYPNREAVNPQEETFDPSATSAAVATEAQGNIAPAIVEAIQEQIPEVAQAVQEGKTVAEAIDAQDPIDRANAIASINNAASKAKDILNPWGILGTPRVTSNSALEAFLSSKEQHSAKEVLQFLKTQLQDRKNPLFHVLDALSRTPMTDVKVRYITKNTEFNPISTSTNASGWYSTDGRGNREIYILGNDFVHSNVTPELVLHELLHHALGNTIANATPTNGVREVVSELGRLRNAAIDFIKANNIKGFDAAVKDVHELVSWGMTNQEFQQQVLSQISLKETNSNTGLKKGFVLFMKAMTKLVLQAAGLNPKEESNINNGISVLVGNVSTLLAHVKDKGNNLELALHQEMSANPMNQVKKLSGTQIFDALTASSSSQVSPAFKTTLRNLVANITDKITFQHGKFVGTVQNHLFLNPMDSLVRAVDEGRKTFTAKALGINRVISDHEAMAIEQIEAVLDTAASVSHVSTSRAFRELNSLYRQARNTLQVQDFHNGDWSIATPEEKRKAKDYRDFLFQIDPSQGPTTYLARFAALGLAHEDFNRILDKVSQRQESIMDAPTLAGKAETAFMRVVNTISSYMAGTSLEASTTQKLADMAQKLVDIEAKKRTRLAQGNPYSMFTAAENRVTEIASSIRATAAEVAGNPILQKLPTPVRATASAVRIVAGGHTERVLGQIQRMNDTATKEVDSWVTGLLNEVRGVGLDVNALIRAARHNDSIRQQRINAVAKSVLAGFKNEGKDLSQAAKSSVTQVLIRTGAHRLLGNYSMADIQGFVEDQSKLQGAIRKELANLSGFPIDQQNYFIAQAKHLAYYAATGFVSSPTLMLNTGNIARMYETPYAGSISTQDASKAEAAISALVSLYGISYAPSVARENLKELLRQEMNRTDGNGVETALRTYAYLEGESKDKLFLNNEALMLHGYVPQITNPHVDIQVAHDNIQSQSLEERGYVRVSDLRLDPHDPVKGTVSLYKMRDGGLLPRVSGALAPEGMSAKGTKKFGGTIESSVLVTQGQPSQLAQLKNQRRKELAALFSPGSMNVNPRNNRDNHLVAVMNGLGEFDSFRYLASHDVMDSHLERDNAIDQVLGALAGSIEGKTNAEKQNRDVLTALKEVFDHEYTARSESFVKIENNSSDPNIREMYRLMPVHTRDMAKQIFGPIGMMVPIELLYPIFGYRKWSLSTSFDKKQNLLDAERAGQQVSEQDVLNAGEQLMTAAVENMLRTYALTKGMTSAQAETYSRRGGMIMRRTGAYWQTAVQMAKDIIVVKSISNLWSNTKDNISFLVMRGVPIKNIIRDGTKAITGAMDYKRDSAELAQLELQLKTNSVQGDLKEAQDRVYVLRLALQRNPVATFIDAGMMPTIVEDVEGEDQFSYKSRITSQIEKFTASINPTVMGVAKNVLMTHDTKPYKWLSTATQLSDFFARYALYEHLRNRETNPLSHEDALFDASESFVNYDVPMHPGMQYLDDVGITMFTKYFLRMQRVLLRMARENPSRVMLGLALRHYIHAVPLVTDASMVARFGNNPFSLGAFSLPFTLSDLPAVKGTMALLR